jgi:hypothetical protein
LGKNENLAKKKIRQWRKRATRSIPGCDNIRSPGAPCLRHWRLTVGVFVYIFPPLAVEITDPSLLDGLRLRNLRR